MAELTLKGDPREARFGILPIGALLGGLLLTRLHSHLLFHSLVEIFTVAVAWSIFFLAWNARRVLENHYVLLVGITSLFVGAIDAAHTLAYKGMGILPAEGANLPTQLWIAGRFLQGFSLLAAPLLFSRRLNARLAFVVVAFVAALLTASVFLGFFPDCYIDGFGLTPFKVASEYVIIIILLASLVLLLQHRGDLDRAVLNQLAGSVFLTMAAELAFTSYVGVYDAANVVGHLLRFAAFCLLYRAIIVTGLVRPYDLLFRNLARSEEALRRSDERYRAFVAASSEGIFRVEVDPPVSTVLPREEQVRLLLDRGRIAECNNVYAVIQGAAKSEEVVGSRLEDAFQDLLRTFVGSGYRVIDVETCEGLPAREARHLARSLIGVVENGSLVRIWGIQRDITQLKRATAERERLIADLQSALAEVKALSGLLPICANCKKIRDDGGYWTQVEAYLEQRADVSFTHGICPECLMSLYPDYSVN